MQTFPIESGLSLASGRRWIVIVALAFLAVAISGTPLVAQPTPSETHRKAVLKVAPHYPEMAKAMKLSGVVRVAVKVAPSSKVLSTEVLGGHPLLARVTVDAVQQWRFEPAPQETEEVVVFTFVP